jgi:hypothetical protein
MTFIFKVLRVCHLGRVQHYPLDHGAKQNPTFIVSGTFYINMYVFNHVFVTFLTNFDSWTQFKTEYYFYLSFSFLVQLHRVKYIKYMRTRKYCLEEREKKRNLYYNGSWQLPHFILAVLAIG